MPSLMSSTDKFVLTSLWEGFGLVVAEAMACERVVVATDSGGVKEVLGDCGFLVSQSETDLLATGIEQALNLDEAEKRDRKSTRLNSSHVASSYAVFCLKKKMCN